MGGGGGRFRLNVYQTSIFVQKAQGGSDSTRSYPGCEGSNWREMGPSWT